MAEKLSSTSSSSSAAYGGTQTHQSRGGNGDAHLVVRRQPPTHVFPNEAFEFEVMLELPRKGCPMPQEAIIELEVSLRYGKKAKPVGPEARLTMIAEGRPIVLATSGPALKRQATITCRIDTATIRRDTGASFLIHVSPKHDVVPGMDAVTTIPIRMVNYKTHILMEEEWEAEWYKDEGGRDKCMDVYAEIRDQNGHRRTGERIPFGLTLCYNLLDGAGSHIEVIKQELLKVLGTGTPNNTIKTDKDTGIARIRFRIDDVSKNHQNQRFKVRVGPPNKLKGFKDIAPGYTPSVLVKSKRNKRPREKTEQYPSPARPFVRAPTPEQKPHRDDYHEKIDLKRLREAMEGVINWTDAVVNGLYGVQWKPVSYAQNPDGTFDRSRPLFTMPNPNACINRVLSMYAESAREDLRVLLSAVEQAGAPRQDESSYGSGSVTREPEPSQSYGMMGNMMQMQMHPQQPPPQLGMPPHLSSGNLSGLHQTAASGAFRGKPENTSATSMLYHHQSTPHPTAVPPHHPQMQFAHACPPQQSIMGDDSDNRSMHSQRMQSAGPRGHMSMEAKPPAKSGGPPSLPETNTQSFDEFETEEVEEVHYVLAKQYNSVRTGDLLGYPAYNKTREILGFYRGNAKRDGEPEFTSISMLRVDFGPLQILQANRILDDAIQNSTNLVYEVKKFGGDMNKLLDHLMVYAWAKELEPASQNPPGPSTG